MMSVLNSAISCVLEKYEDRWDFYSGKPSILRIMKAACIASGMTDDENVIAAVFLQNIINEISEEEVREKFGAKVWDCLEPFFPDGSKSYEIHKRDNFFYVKNNANIAQKKIVLANELARLQILHNGYEKCGDSVFNMFEISKDEYSRYVFSLMTTLDVLSDYCEYIEFTVLVEDIFVKKSFWALLKQIFITDAEDEF